MENISVPQDSRPWTIRDKGVVLGRYKLEHIEDLIASKRINPHTAEVAHEDEPDHWSSFDQHPQFQKYAAVNNGIKLSRPLRNTLPEESDKPPQPTAPDASKAPDASDRDILSMLQSVQSSMDTKRLRTRKRKRTKNPFKIIWAVLINPFIIYPLAFAVGANLAHTLYTPKDTLLDLAIGGAFFVGFAYICRNHLDDL